MRQASVLFTCKICSDKFKLDFKRPTLVMPVYFERSCANCDAQYEFWVKVQKGTNGQGYDVESRCDRVVRSPLAPLEANV